MNVSRLLVVALFAAFATISAHAVERTKITMWFWGAQPEYREALERHLVTAFNGSQSQYELVIEYRRSVDNDVRLAAIANRGPDIVFTAGPGNVWPLARAGKLAPLEGFDRRFGWHDRLLEPVLDTCRQFGHLYCVTPSLFTNGMFYNKAVLQANGWKVPKTAGELESIMKAAQAKGLYASVTGNADWQPVNEDYLSIFLNQIVGPSSVRDLLTGHMAWTAKPVVTAMTELDRWYKAGYLGGNDYFVLDFDTAFALLAQRKAPFFFAPTFSLQWAARYFKGIHSEDLGFAPFPQMNPRLPFPIYDVGSAFTLSINSNSKVTEGAARVLDFILSSGFARAIGKEWPGYWSIPLKEFPVDDGAIGVFRIYNESMAEISKAVQRGAFGFDVTTFFPNKTKELLTQDIEAVWLGEESPAEMLGRAAKTFEQERKRGAVMDQLAVPDFR
jgi:raffinose/stachyose/melibiose transport system substrate-binding protein